MDQKRNEGDDENMLKPSQEAVEAAEKISEEIALYRFRSAEKIVASEIIQEAINSFLNELNIQSKPSSEAKQAATKAEYLFDSKLWKEDLPDWEERRTKILEAAYAIDMAPLQQRIEELENKNKEQLKELERLRKEISLLALQRSPF